MTSPGAQGIAQIQAELLSGLKDEDPTRLEATLDELHASDLADILESLAPEDQVAVVRALPPEVASDALSEMEEGEARRELLAALLPAESAELLHELADDDAADLIAELEPDERARVLAELPADEAGELAGLLLYDEESAGGLMTTALVSIHESITAYDAIGEVRLKGREVEDFYTVFVVDGAGVLLGTVPLDELILADPDTPVARLVEPVVASVLPDVDQEAVSRLLSRYNLVSIPVVDPAHRLLGRITFDDVMDVLEAEQTEDILRLAGVTDEEEVRGGWLEAVRSRLPWLLLNLVTASLAASVIIVFERTLETIIALTFLMPIIAAMGGNAGTQALAVTLRRLSLSEGGLGGRDWDPVVKEILVGLVNGAVLGLLAALLGYWRAGVPALGFVVLVAMWGNLMVAGFAGAFVPTALNRIGVDPAVASSVFVHTLTDLCGFFLLLGLASWLLL